MKETFKIPNLKELDDFAKRIAKNSFPSMFLGLIGDLGSGKTQFTKFFVKHLGGNIEDVVSPTFTIMNEYLTEKYTIYHFDLYRLNSIEELEEIGYKDFFFDKNAITIVEWIDKIPEAIPDKHLIINFKFGEKENSRILEITKNL